MVQPRGERGKRLIRSGIRRKFFKGNLRDPAPRLAPASYCRNKCGSSEIGVAGKHAKQRQIVGSSWRED